MRPPLSKEIWFNDNEESVKNLVFKQWNGSERSVYYEPSDFYLHPNKLNESEHGGVALTFGYSVTKIDVRQKKAYLDNGHVISYGKCLIATGDRI